MFGKRLTRALAVTAVASLVMALAVFADTVSNSIDNTVDDAAESMALTVGGGSGSTLLYVSNTNAGTPTYPDSTNACNLAGAASLTIAVSSSDATKATAQLVSPTDDSVAKTVFNDCTARNADGTFPTGADLIKVLVSPVAAGSTTITVSQVSTTAPAGADFYYAPATFTVNVAPPPDSTPPVITYVVDPAAPDGSNGWYKGDVTLTWTVTENESPSSLVKTGCENQNIAVDQAATSYSCSATSTGGSAGPVTVTIKRDGTASAVAYTSAEAAVLGGGPNAAGWYKSNVVATFTATDNLSGFNADGDLTAIGTSTTSGEGSAVTVGSPAFTDWAGNTVAAGAVTSPSFKIDKTAPVVSVTGVANGATYILGAVPAAGCSTVETLSGVKTATTLSVSGGPIGSVTATCSAATDNADNTGSPASVTYTVSYHFDGFYAPVDNGSVLNVVKAGQAVPLKWRLTDANGNPILSGVSASVSVASLSCSAGSTVDLLEEVASGSSGLQNLGDGYYQFNWKTPTSYASSCKTMSLNLGDGSPHTALFQFKK
jgi:hypothetical protein